LSQNFRSLELIVVDNSTEPRINHAIRRSYKTKKKFRYVIERTQGLSHARNKGTAVARGRYVAFIDDDAVAEPDWAKELLRAFAQYPGAGCVGGRIVPRWLAPRPDWLTDDLLGYLSLVDWGGKTRKARKGEWLAGCNIAYDRALLLAVGGFPRDLGRRGAGANLLSNEELKVAAQIRAAGRPIVYSPRAVVEHRIPPERLTKRWFLRRAAWQAVSDYIAFGKQPSRSSLFSRLARLAGVMARDDFRWEMREVYDAALRRLHRDPGLVAGLDGEPDFLQTALHLHL
jgi:GT2 family glycosyltransferase